VRRAYRDAYSDCDHVRAMNAMYARFMDLYGVSLDTLLQIVEEDQRRHRAEYTGLQAIRIQALNERREARRKTKGEEPEVSPGQYYGRSTYCPVCLRELGAERMPRHDDTRWHVCNGSGRFGVTQYTAEQLRRTKGRQEYERSPSIRTVSGGLPGLGKGHR